MDANLQQILNKAIGGSLKGLGLASARNFVALEKSFGSQPLKWMAQLSADLDGAFKDFKHLLDAPTEGEDAPANRVADMTKALERVAVASFCLQIVTKSAGPRDVVVVH